MAKRQNGLVLRGLFGQPAEMGVRVLVAGLAALGATACGDEVGRVAMTFERCSTLSSMTLIDFEITESRHVLADVTGPAHCRVQGVIDIEINFELLLPDVWNGRFVMGGGGGYVGTVQNAALDYGDGPGALARGYATVGTDTGHSGSGVEAAWALGGRERQINFG